MAQLKAKRAKKALPAASDSSDAEASVASGDEGNTGWANSMLKVLETTKSAAQKPVLSRAKKLKPTNAQTEKKAKKDYDFEIDGAEVKEEEQDKSKDVKPDESTLNAELTKQQRKNVPLQLRVKPNFRDLERERNLRKVATRGTVQFFNAVRIQQKDIKQQLVEAGPLDSRQDAVLNNIDKRKFLDVLMSGKRAKSALIDNPVKKEEQETDSDDEQDDEEPSDDEKPSTNKKKKEWNVLREDFMTNKKIKHWDEEDDDEPEEADNNSDDSDDE
ncbi:RRP15-like protein [Drosophila nasuta]|uniref:RRP15-like protein n=1 Tax=Drosophila nasuta TaxID=42062 RepID=UPI00295EE845|nr:RRP15-like protein [Drosophila nasuta]